MRITIICEGRTEQAFKEALHSFLKTRLVGKMPALDFSSQHGSIPTETKLRRVVENLLNGRVKPSDAVIALTDVYPGYVDAADAKAKLRGWVGIEPRFYPHVALHDFEAWLLPYWDRIMTLAGRRAKSPGAHPEKVNHGNPPAYRLARLFEEGTCRDSYNKPRDAKRILKDADLMTAIVACPELKAFVNTIISLCDTDPKKLVP
jgi:hypothetical protein